MPTYYVNPAVAADTNNGSSWALAYKTLKHAFAAGDVINLARSAETGQAGTVTATKGSVTVNTTNDLTGVLNTYSFIRINNDSTIYMVYARTSTTITLYRPYRGNTGSGYGITTLAALTIASGDFTPTSGNGAAGNPITLNAGIDTGTNAQSGFTVLNANNASYAWSSAARSFWNLTNLGMYYFGSAWTNGNQSDCIFTNCFMFRGAFPSNDKSFIRCTFTNLVCEVTPFNYCDLFSCTINGIETANPAANGMGISSNKLWTNSVISNWKNAGYSGAGHESFSLGGHSQQLKIIDSIFDELASNCAQVIVNSTNIISDIVFQNPTVGGGTLISTATYGLIGTLAFNAVNGNYTDNRKYCGFNEATAYHLLSYDASTYKSAPAAAKITAVGPSTFPVTIRHYIPCDAGVPKTVSVWLRKSSSPAYGSSNLPFMRLRWMTGTGASMVSNVYDTAMSDTNDSFVQVSHAVTPSVQGVIIMELIFQAGANNALAWYDDIGVA